MQPPESPLSPPAAATLKGATAPPASLLTQAPQGRSWVWILLTLGLVGSGLLLGHLLKPQQTPAQSAAPQGPPPRPVETIPLTPGAGVQQIQLIGQVEATKQATIRAQTPGVVQQVLVNPGDRVTAGMTVAILDQAEPQLAVAAAQARLAQERSELARLEVGTRAEIIAQRQAELGSAQAREQEALDNLQRTLSLIQQGAIAQRTLVEAQTTLAAAQNNRLEAAAALAEAQAGPTAEEIQAQQALVAAAEVALNQARLTLERTQIRAIASGSVASREVSPGDLVESGDAVLTLVDNRELDVFLELPETLSGRINSGFPVQLTSRALPEWQTQTAITGVVPAANATSRRQRVRVRLENPPAGLLPGMAIQGNLELRANAPSFVISRDALTRRQNQWFLFSVTEGKARQFPVELVADMGEQVAIYHPQLRAGLPVVIRGGDGLKEGAPVQVVGANQ